MPGLQQDDGHLRTDLSDETAEVAAVDGIESRLRDPGVGIPVEKDRQVIRECAQLDVLARFQDGPGVEDVEVLRALADGDELLVGHVAPGELEDRRQVLPRQADTGAQFVGNQLAVDQPPVGILGEQDLTFTEQHQRPAGQVGTTMHLAQVVEELPGSVALGGEFVLEDAGDQPNGLTGVRHDDDTNLDLRPAQQRHRRQGAVGGSDDTGPQQVPRPGRCLV